MSDQGDVPSPSNRSLHSRRALLRLALAAGAGTLGLALISCSNSATGPSAAPTTAPAGVAPAGAAGWDALVAAAQKEGKVVVSGPPAPDARTKLPEAFKSRFGIEMEYLGGNTSQLASRLESERAAGQYTIDVSMSGPDTAYATFIPNKWLDPIKSALVLPEVTDPSVYSKGGPWFRDPSGELTMQIFESISPIGYVNTSVLQPSEVPTTTEALLDPKLKGKIASYDPSVNGGGLIFGSVLYVTRGQEFATKFYQGQEVAYTRDYQQIADWVAHGSYGIGIGATPLYVAQYADAVPLQMFKLSDIKTIVSGGFSIISLFNQAPHPNAARLYVNWIASKEGVATYGKIDANAPVRTDVEPSWMAPELVPKPGGDYFDVYDYTYVTETRQKVAKIYASLKGS